MAHTDHGDHSSASTTRWMMLTRTKAPPASYAIWWCCASGKTELNSVRLHPSELRLLPLKVPLSAFSPAPFPASIAPSSDSLLDPIPSLRYSLTVSKPSWSYLTLSAETDARRNRDGSQR